MLTGLTIKKQHSLNVPALRTGGFLRSRPKSDFGAGAPKKQLLQVVRGPGKLFLPVGAKTCFGEEAPRQQGRQECRPSDGPATLLSPMVGLESCFFPSGPKLVLVGRLPCSRGDKSVAHPTDRRPPEDSEVALAIGATSVSPIRRTGDTPVADGGHEGVLRSPTTHHPKKQLLQVIGGPGKLFLPVGAKTCFGGEALMQQGRQECRPSDGPATLLSPMVATEICLFPSGPKLVLVGELLRNCSGRFSAITNTYHLWRGDQRGPRSPLCGSEPGQSPSAQGTVRTTFADILGVFARGDIHRSTHRDEVRAGVERAERG